MPLAGSLSCTFNRSGICPSSAWAANCGRAACGTVRRYSGPPRKVADSRAAADIHSCCQRTGSRFADTHHAADSHCIPDHAQHILRGSDRMYAAEPHDIPGGIHPAWVRFPGSRTCGILPCLPVRLLGFCLPGGGCAGRRAKAVDRTRSTLLPSGRLRGIARRAARLPCLPVDRTEAALLLRVVQGRKPELPGDTAVTSAERGASCSFSCVWAGLASSFCASGAGSGSGSGSCSAWACSGGDWLNSRLVG